MSDRLCLLASQRRRLALEKNPQVEILLAGQGLSMLMAVAEPVFIVSPRYADEVAAASTDLGAVPSIERRPERAAERFETEPARVIVIDARGALTQGLAAARSVDAAVKTRHGAMLVLLSRADGFAAVAAHDAGATSVLVSPFGSATYGDALRLAITQTRAYDAAARSCYPTLIASR